jgi:hypothetical protein
MTIDDRIKATEAEFLQKQEQRNEHLKVADENTQRANELLTVMHRLQGKYDALAELKDSKKDKAKTITAEPKVEEKK